MRDINVVIAGAAGEGVQTIGAIVSRTVLAQGYAVFTWQEYESRLRGGQNSYSIRISDEPHNAPLMEAGEKIPIGVLFQTSERTVFGNRFRETVTKHPLSELDPIDAGEIKRLLQKFRPEAG